LMGMPLQQTLDIYGMDFAPGKTNGCGNSGVEIQMFEDEEGNQCGMLRVKPTR